MRSLSLLFVLIAAGIYYVVAQHGGHGFEFDVQGQGTRSSYGVGLNQFGFGAVSQQLQQQPILNAASWLQQQQQLPAFQQWNQNPQQQQQQQQQFFNDPSLVNLGANPSWQQSAQPMHQSKSEKLTYAAPIVTYAQPIIQKVDTTPPKVQKQTLMAQAIVQPTFQVAPVLRTAAITAVAPTIQKGFGSSVGLGQAWNQPQQVQQQPKFAQKMPMMNLPQQASVQQNQMPQQLGAWQNQQEIGQNEEQNEEEN